VEYSRHHPYREGEVLGKRIEVLFEIKDRNEVFFLAYFFRKKKFIDACYI
jgi:hypothetical protein